MRSRTLIKTFTTVLVVVFCAGIFTGCSNIIRSVRLREAEEFGNRFVEEYNDADDLRKVLDDNSDKKIQDLNMLADQQKIMDHTFEQKVRLSSIILDEDENKATFYGYLYHPDFSELDDEYRTVEDWEKFFGLMTSTRMSLELPMIYEHGSWMFEDLGELYEELGKNYSTLGILNTEGVPVNPTPEFYKDLTSEAIWYDPILSIPLEDDKLEDPVALQCAFYFVKPVKVSLTAELVNGEGESLKILDVSLDGSVIVVCDFSLELMELKSFKTGEYTVKLYYDGTEINSTPVVKVS